MLQGFIGFWVHDPGLVRVRVRVRVRVKVRVRARVRVRNRVGVKFRVMVRVRFRVRVRIRVGVGVGALTWSTVYCLSYYVVSSLVPKLKLSHSLVCPLFLLSQHSSLDFVRSLWHWHHKGERARTASNTLLAQARNRNRLYVFLTGLFLYSHIFI
jgi:hypothetical protein